MIGAIRRALGVLPRPLRRRWFAQVPLALLAAALEAATAAVLFVAMSALVDPDGSPEGASFAWLAAGVIGFYVLKNGILVLIHSLRHRIVFRSTAAVAGSLLERYLATHYAFHLQRNSAELIRNLLESTDTVYRFVMVD